MAGTEIQKIDFEKNKKEPPFQAALFAIEKGMESKIDQHKASEIWMMLQGSGILFYDNKKYVMSTGDIVFFDPFKVHHIFNCSNEKIYIFTIWWE